MLPGGVLERGHVADAAVHRVGHELDALVIRGRYGWLRRPRRGARWGGVLGLNSRPTAAASINCEGQVAGLVLGGGNLPYLTEQGQAQHGAVELGGRGEVVDEDGGEVDAGDVRWRSGH